MSVFETKKKRRPKLFQRDAEKTSRDEFRQTIEEFEKACGCSMLERPKILDRSNIKQTKCGRCKSIYQAGWEHTRQRANRIDIIPTVENLQFVTECPCCGWYNEVEFEEEEAIE